MQNKSIRISIIVRLLKQAQVQRAKTPALVAGHWGHGRFFMS